MELCAFPGCDNPRSPKASKGLCNSHYWQLHKGRELTPLRYRRNKKMPWLVAHVKHEGDDCLTWPFHRNNQGYGQVQYDGHLQVASRVMCELAHGAPPTPGHEAAHSCGKGADGCVNPKHLRWATRSENEADKLIHGTRLRGEGAPWSKVTEQQVRAIRELAGTTSRRELADRFGLRLQHVHKIVHRTIWSHV